MHFTPIEEKLLDLLRDGKPHSIQSIKEAIDPDHPDLVETWKEHISRLRKKTEQQGYAIIYAPVSREVNYSHYRLVRLLKEPANLG